MYNRPEVLTGRTIKLDAECGSIFAIINNDGEQVREIGIINGKSGNCTNLLLRVISLLVSKMLQSSIPLDEIKDILDKHCDGNCGKNLIYFQGEPYKSCIDYIFKNIIAEVMSYEEIAQDKSNQQKEE